MTKLRNMRVIEIPSFRAVTSGEKTFDALFAPDGFDRWCAVHAELMRDTVFEPVDFLWHVGAPETYGRGLNVWIRAIKEGVTPDETAPYEIFEFPGGIFLVATADENDPDDLNETVVDMMRWIEDNDIFEYGDFPRSGMCNMPGGVADALLGIAQQQIFLPLKRKLERKERQSET